MSYNERDPSPGDGNTRVFESGTDQVLHPLSVVVEKLNANYHQRNQDRLKSLHRAALCRTGSRPPDRRNPASFSFAKRQ